jgi:hypothetical protein
MGKGGHLARHRPQAEARLGVVARGLEPPVVEPERLRTAILQIQLAIVGAGERVGGQRCAASGESASR